MIVEYILIGVICFSAGNMSAKTNHKNCNNKKIVIMNKHNKHKSIQRKFRKMQKKRGWHYHKDGTIQMMCHNGWSW